MPDEDELVLADRAKARVAVFAAADCAITTGEFAGLSAGTAAVLGSALPTVNTRAITNPVTIVAVKRVTLRIQNFRG